MLKILKDFFSDDTGATAIEYGLLIAIIALGISLSLGNISTAIQNTIGITETAIRTNEAP